ncbi:MAG: hypothetical protein R3C05_30905 [Pirellulaceae bacterium]
MTWHEHRHRGSYRNHAGPSVKNYLFPKPWEALPVGPRTPPPSQATRDDDDDIVTPSYPSAEEIKPGKVLLAPPIQGTR